MGSAASRGEIMRVAGGLGRGFNELLGRGLERVENVSL